MLGSAAGCVGTLKCYSLLPLDADTCYFVDAGVERLGRVGHSCRRPGVSFRVMERLRVIGELRHYVLKGSAAAVIVAGTILSAFGLEVAAPFGFAWGPLDRVPKPSLALKDANVTVLAYRRERLPGNELADTDIVLLDVCKKEGLQQVSWAGKALSSEEASAKLVQLVALGVQKYGEAKPSDEGALGWDDGRIEILRVAGSGGEYRILMVHRGPDFETCAAEHDLASDQKLKTRWLQRIEFPN